MDRRQVVKKIALMVGGSISLPTLLAMKQNALSKNISDDLIFTEHQRLIVADVSQQIIPKTNTAGAIDAGVPAFIEIMLKDCYQLPEKESFISGLQNLHQLDYLNKSKDEKVQILKTIEQNNKGLMKAYNVQQSKIGDNEDKELMTNTKNGLPFWRLMKELTLIGYFTSEVGLKDSFEYVPIPGKLVHLKLSSDQKHFAY
jgi:hypothetical protein